MQSVADFEGIRRVRTEPRQTKRQAEAARGRRAVAAFHARQRAMPEVRRLRNAAKLAKRRELIAAKRDAAIDAAFSEPAIIRGSKPLDGPLPPASSLILDDHHVH